MTRQLVEGKDCGWNGGGLRVTGWTVAEFGKGKDLTALPVRIQSMKFPAKAGRLSASGREEMSYGLDSYELDDSS